MDGMHRAVRNIRVYSIQDAHTIIAKQADEVRSLHSSFLVCVCVIR